MASIQQILQIVSPVDSETGPLDGNNEQLSPGVVYEFLQPDCDLSRWPVISKDPATGEDFYSVDGRKVIVKGLSRVRMKNNHTKL